MRKRTTAVLVGVATAGLLGTGIATAAAINPADSTDGQIRWCYSESPTKVPNNFVQFREENFWDQGGTCGAGYKGFLFNREGPQGEVGPQGGAGAAGQQGPQGQQGEQGETGPSGLTGLGVGAPEAQLPQGPFTKTVSCGAGRYATGGGYQISAGQATVNTAMLDGITEVAPDRWLAMSYTVKGVITSSKANIKPQIVCASLSDAPAAE